MNTSDEIDDVQIKNGNQEAILLERYLKRNQLVVDECPLPVWNWDCSTQSTPTQCCF